MLPIFRMISVGGVLLAIAILGLALTPPGGSHLRLAAVDAPASGALIDRNKHPEWRQFIIQAALRRADAIRALRDLPDAAMRLPEIPDVAPPYVAPVFPQLSVGEKEKVAGLPARDGGDPEDVTGSIATTPEPIPIEIGETSSTELPAISPDDKPPAIRMPVSAAPESQAEPRTSLIEPAQALAIESAKAIKTPTAPRKKTVPRRRVAAAKPETSPPAAASVSPPFNFLQILFQSFANQPAAEKPAGTAGVHARGKARPAKPAKNAKLSRAVAQ
jgi:hypothetical protein